MKKISSVSVGMEAPAPSPIHAKASVSRHSKPKPPLHRARPLSTPNGAPQSKEGPLDAEQILAALVALKKGDFNARLPLDWTGVAGKVADTFNEVAEMMAHSTGQLSRISRLVGKEGRIQERLGVGH